MCPSEAYVRAQPPNASHSSVVRLSSHEWSTFIEKCTSKKFRFSSVYGFRHISAIRKRRYRKQAPCCVSLLRFRAQPPNASHSSVVRLSPHEWSTFIEKCTSKKLRFSSVYDFRHISAIRKRRYREQAPISSFLMSATFLNAPAYFQ